MSLALHASGRTMAVLLPPLDLGFDEQPLLETVGSHRALRPAD
jgi:hypothetical protein